VVIHKVKAKLGKEQFAELITKGIREILLRIEEEENRRKTRNPRKVGEILENGMEIVCREVRENINYLQEIKEEIVQKLIESKQNIAKMY
jgi:hypothetical protein